MTYEEVERALGKEKVLELAERCQRFLEEFQGEDFLCLLVVMGILIGRMVEGLVHIGHDQERIHRLFASMAEEASAKAGEWIAERKDSLS